MKRFILVLSLCLISSINFAGCGKKEVVNTLPQNNSNVENMNKVKTPDIAPVKIRNKYADQTQTVTNPKNLFSYLNLTKEQIIKQLGNNYKEEILQKDSGDFPVLNYEDIGVRVRFWGDSSNGNDDNVLSILCSSRVTINGASAGMNFKQVQEKLGPTKITHIYYPEVPEDYYEVIYIINDVVLEFTSGKNDGSNSSLEILKNNQGDIAKIEVEKVIGLTDENKYAYIEEEKQINMKTYFKVGIIHNLNDSFESQKDEEYYVDKETYKVYILNKSSGKLVLLSKSLD
jgi:hypothetical protein